MLTENFNERLPDEDKHQWKFGDESDNPIKRDMAAGEIHGFMIDILKIPEWIKKIKNVFSRR